MPELSSVTQEHITELENQIDSMNTELKPPREFILPSGSKAATCHLARTQCRVAETQLIALMESNPDTNYRPEVIAYMNRLSDWLFVAARIIVHHDHQAEVLWKNPFARKET